MRFWDSTAVLPLLQPEATTPQVAELPRQDAVVLVWWGTQVECSSAVARLEREGALTTDRASAVLARLDGLLAGWHEIQPSDSIREAARRLLRLHPLRAADALQLAAAIEAAENRPSGLVFVCLDHRLRAAAQREGFGLDPPAWITHPLGPGRTARSQGEGTLPLMQK